MIKCRSKPGTGALREATLPAHRDFLDNFKAETWYSGPMLEDDGVTAAGSFRLIDFPDRGAARDYIDNDPYTLAEIFRTIDIERWRPLTTVRQRDYARRDGSIQFVVITRMSDATDLETKIAKFIEDRWESIIAAGSLTDDTGDKAQGVLYLMDVPSRDAAMAMLAADPLTRSGRQTSQSVERWRFGHV